MLPDVINGQAIFYQKWIKRIQFRPMLYKIDRKYTRQHTVIGK